MTAHVNPIARAVDILREAAADLKLCHTVGVSDDWTGEEDAKAAHDEYLAVATALERGAQAGALQAVKLPPLPKRHGFFENEQTTAGWTAEQVIAYARSALAATQPNAAPAAEVATNGAPYGIIDPDYARIFTQARILAWQYGFALVMHGSFTRDLDLLLVPWEDRAFGDAVERIVNMLAEQCDLKIREGDPANKPHGRKCWTLYFSGFGDRRWVDLSVMPTLAAPAAAIDAREQEAALPPMTCKHSNRSDCALFGSEETPVKFQRPSREWYASKIQETLDDDFLIGAQAPADIPPPSAAERGLTKAERQMMDYLFSNMGHLTDAEWRQHGFRRATFDRLEKKLSDYRPALASRSEAPAARPNAAGQEPDGTPLETGEGDAR